MSEAVGEPRHHALIPAAGVGRRMGSELPKQYLEILGRPILEHVLRRFLASAVVDTVTVCLAPGDAVGEAIVRRVSAEFAAKPCAVAPGGAERCHSVLNGCRAIGAFASPADWVLVHDAARPCLTDTDLERLVATLRDDLTGGILATPLRDTLKRAGADDGTGAVAIAETVPRDGLWQALTPQLFRLQVLTRAIEGALEAGTLVTDEAQAVELAGYTPKLVAGRTDNLKVTLPEDLALAEVFLRHHEPA